MFIRMCEWFHIKTLNHLQMAVERELCDVMIHTNIAELCELNALNIRDNNTQYLS